MRTSSFDLTAEDGQLLAEQVDPGVLGEGVHVVDAQDLDNATNDAVEKKLSATAWRNRRSDRG